MIGICEIALQMFCESKIQSNDKRDVVKVFIFTNTSDEIAQFLINKNIIQKNPSVKNLTYLYP